MGKSTRDNKEIPADVLAAFGEPTTQQGGVPEDVLKAFATPPKKKENGAPISQPSLKDVASNLASRMNELLESGSGKSTSTYEKSIDKFTGRKKNPESVSKKNAQKQFLEGTPASPFYEKKPTELNIANRKVKVDAPVLSPLNRDDYTTELQKRIDYREFTPEDVQVVAKSMNVSPTVAMSYMEGKNDIGTVMEIDETVQKNKQPLLQAISEINKEFGTSYNPDEVFSSAKNISSFVDDIEKKYKEKTEKQVEAKVEIRDFQHPASIVAEYESANIFYGKENQKQFNLVKSLFNNAIINAAWEDPNLTYEQKIKDATYNIDKKEYKNIIEAKVDRATRGASQNIGTQLGNLYDYITGAAEKEDIQFNSTKGRVEQKMNSKLAESIAYNNSLINLLVNEANEKAANNTLTEQDAIEVDKTVKQLQSKIELDKKQYQTPEQLQKKYPSLFASELADVINEYNAITSGHVVGFEKGEAPNDLNLLEYLTVKGYDVNDQRVKDAMDMVKLKDYSFFGSPLKAVGEEISAFGKSIGDLTGFRSESNILSEKIQEQNFPETISEDDRYQLTEKAKIGQNIGRTTGQVIGQGLLQYGTAGMGRLGGLSRLAAANAGFWSSGALGMYDRAYKDGIDLTDNEAARVAYAGMNALFSAATEKLFPESKFIVSPIVEKSLKGVVSKVGKEGFTKELTSDLLDKAKKSWVEGVTKWAKNTGKNISTETIEETATSLFESGTRFLYGDPNMNAEEAIKRAKETAIQTAVGTSLIGAYGGYKDMRTEKNIAPKSMLYNAALYHDEAMDAINKGYLEGEYDEQERNVKIQTLNTARTAIDVTNQTAKINNINLSRPQKEVYVANLTAEALLKKEKDGVDDDLLAGKIDEKIKNLQSQRNDILEGKLNIDEFGNISQDVPEKVEVSDIETKKAYDFDDTLFDNKTGELTELGQKIKERIAKGEDIKIVTARNQDDTEVIKEQLGISDTNIVATGDEKLKSIVPENDLSETETTIQKLNNAENINEGELEKSQDVLYQAWDNAPEARHLIEPLIQKLQDYEFATTTETRTVTEKVPTGRTAKTKIEVKPILEQGIKSRVTITNEKGQSVDGILQLEDGNYEVYNEEGNKVASLGEKVLADKGLKLSDQTDTPIELDENRNVQSVTVQTQDGKTVKINNPDVALDVGIQLSIQEFGEVPDDAFQEVYEEVEKQVQVEVPKQQSSKEIKNEPSKQASENVSERVSQEDQRSITEGSRNNDAKSSDKGAGNRASEKNIPEEQLQKNRVNISSQKTQSDEKDNSNKGESRQTDGKEADGKSSESNRKEEVLTEKEQPTKKEAAPSKLDLADKKVQQSVNDLRDAFNEWRQSIKGDKLGISDKSVEAQAKMIAAGIKVIGAYAEKGIYKFSEIANDLSEQFGDKTDEFLNALKQAYAAVSSTDKSGKYDSEKKVNEFEFQEEQQVNDDIKKTRQRDWNKLKLDIAKILEADDTISAEQIINIKGEKTEEGKRIIREMVAKKREGDSKLLADAKAFVDDQFEKINRGKEISKTAINIAKSDLADVIDYIADKFIVYDVINNKNLEKFADATIKLFGDNYESAIEHLTKVGSKISASAKPILLAKIAVKLNADGKGKEAAKVMEKLLDESNITGRTLQVFKKVNDILNVRGTPEYKTEMAKRIVQKSKEMADAQISQIQAEADRKLGENEQKIKEYEQQLDNIRNENHKSTLSKIKDKMNDLINKICKTRK